MQEKSTLPFLESFQKNQRIIKPSSQLKLHGTHYRYFYDKKDNMHGIFEFPLVFLIDLDILFVKFRFTDLKI